jgi:hypothetical protein
MKILHVEAEFFHAVRHRDGQTELRQAVMTKLIVTFCNFADTPDYRLYWTLCNYCTNCDMFRRQEACMITKQCSMA